MNKTFWMGKRVLVTGHTGFKGSWLTLWLEQLGAQVYGLSLPPATQPSLYADLVDHLNVSSTFGDVRDENVVGDVMQSASPDIVLHLAAQALVRPSYETPVETLSTNVIGTAHVLQQARKLPDLKAVVIVTSDKCYENREWIWSYREHDALGGWDPYSASKGCAEIVTSAFCRSFFHNARVASARAGNVVGGGDWSQDRLVPDTVKAWSRGEKPLIRNPGAVRPWQHVLEPLAGYLTLAEHLATDPEAFAEAWNFGPDEEGSRSVGDILDYMERCWPNAVGWTQGTSPQPHEANLLKLDASKARARLAWKPRLTTEAALDWVVEWYHGYTTGGTSAWELTSDQIRRYEQHLGEEVV